MKSLGIDYVISRIPSYKDFCLGMSDVVKIEGKLMLRQTINDDMISDVFESIVGYKFINNGFDMYEIMRLLGMALRIPEFEHTYSEVL